MEWMLRVLMFLSALAFLWFGKKNISNSISGFKNYKGKVIAQAQVLTSNPINHLYSYRFTYIYDGKEYEAIKQLSGNYAVIGKKKRIRVNKDNPEDIYAGRVITDILFGLFSICIGLMCLLGVLVM